MALVLPHTISNGTTADATEVEENFQEIEDYVNNELLTQATFDTAPIGLVAYNNYGADSTTFTTLADLSISGAVSLTWMALASRRYKISLHGHIESTVAGDYARLAIADSGGTIIVDTKTELPVANESQTVDCFRVVTISPGSVTYKVQGERISGTGSVKVDGSPTSPLVFSVEDLGIL